MCVFQCGSHEIVFCVCIFGVMLFPFSSMFPDDDKYLKIAKWPYFDGELIIGLITSLFTFTLFIWSFSTLVSRAGLWLQMHYFVLGFF